LSHSTPMPGRIHCCHFTDVQTEVPGGMLFTKGHTVRQWQSQALLQSMTSFSCPSVSASHLPVPRPILPNASLILMGFMAPVPHSWVPSLVGTPSTAVTRQWLRAGCIPGVIASFCTWSLPGLQKDPDKVRQRPRSCLAETKPETVLGHLCAVWSLVASFPFEASLCHLERGQIVLWPPRP
jgi:hypothetical protein